MADGMGDVATLVALATAVPDYVLNQAAVMALAVQIFGADHQRRLEQLFRNSGIETRYGCMPLAWYGAAHDFAERNDCYIEHAVDLLSRAAQRALAKANLTTHDIDGIVCVSSSGVATPSLDALVIERLRLRRDIARLPIFGLGCVGGVVGLARAAEMAKARPGQHILLLVVELCTLTFRQNDQSKSNQVATALFGDGAAAAIVGTDLTGPRILASGEYSWPDSLGVMGWDVGGDGLKVIFSKDIPRLVRQDFRLVLDDFLAANQIPIGDIDHFVCHPGGAKVIDALEDALDLPTGALIDARAILRDYGNMSAVTVLFILERTLRRARTGCHLLTALGPGFTAGFLLLRA